MKMTENEIAKMVVDLCYKIHVGLGPGLLESVYEEVLCYELRKADIRFERQPEIHVEWDGMILEKGFRADIIVEDKVIIELKSVEILPAVAPKILLTYLRLSDKRLGLLVNFSAPLIKNGIYRIVNGLVESKDAA
jgi:GxxExxY protein